MGFLLELVIKTSNNKIKAYGIVMTTFIKKILKTSILVFVGVWSFFIALFSGFLFLVFLGLGIGAGVSTDYNKDPSAEFIYGDASTRNQLASITIEGMILGEPLASDIFSDFLFNFGVTYGYEVKEQLHTLAEDDEVDGVILEIHSPGGTLYGTQAIVDGVAEYKKLTGKPVYAYIGSMAASGGYWVASSADKVIADAGTTVGSIGVIMGPFKYYDRVISESEGVFGATVDTLGGVTTEYIIAGKHKDFGNPYRKMTAEEREALQKGVDLAYQSFVDFVAEKRQIPAEKITNQIGAMAYGELQAKDLGLVDELNNREEAYNLLAKKAGLDEGDFKVVRVTRQPSLIKSLFGSFVGGAPGFRAEPSFCHQQAIMAYTGSLSAYCR